MGQSAPRGVAAEMADGIGLGDVIGAQVVRDRVRVTIVIVSTYHTLIVGVMSSVVKESDCLTSDILDSVAI